MHLLPHVDIDYDQLSPRSSPGNCPSLTESFLSTQGSSVYTDPTRRSSFTSSTTNSPHWYSSQLASTTSPTTPLTSIHPFSIDDQQMKMEQGLEREHIYHVDPNGLPELDFWMGAQDSSDLSHVTSMTVVPLMGVIGTSELPSYCSSYSHYPQTVSMSNPALSRSMFDVNDAVSEVRQGDEESSLLWSALTSSPPQTIAPSAAFPPLLVSSPVTKHEPSTPIRMSTHASVMFSSSPMGLMSPPIVPSQHDADDAKYELADHEIDLLDFPKHRPSVDRLHRRGYERKRHVGISSRPKPVVARTGLLCEALIPQNEFPCSFTGCGKRFKRQEHRKRHERTVHEKHLYPMYVCWVKTCGRDFSRTDNLKSHLKNTHGKNSPNQRNDYVATLDENSEYYDPDWVGEIDPETHLPVDLKV